MFYLMFPASKLDSNDYQLIFNFPANSASSSECHQMGLIYSSPLGTERITQLKLNQFRMECIAHTVAVVLSSSLG